MTIQGAEVPRSERMELRATPDEKVLLTRAAAMEHLDVTSFVLRTALPVAREVVERSEQVMLSERDTLHVLALLESPPSPTASLAAAAKVWAENQLKLNR